MYIYIYNVWCLFIEQTSSSRNGVFNATAPWRLKMFEIASQMAILSGPRSFISSSEAVQKKYGMPNRIFLRLPCVYVQARDRVIGLSICRCCHCCRCPQKIGIFQDLQLQASHEWHKTVNSYRLLKIHECDKL